MLAIALPLDFVGGFKGIGERLNNTGPITGRRIDTAGTVQKLKKYEKPFDYNTPRRLERAIERLRETCLDESRLNLFFEYERLLKVNGIKEVRRLKFIEAFILLHKISPAKPLTEFTRSDILSILDKMWSEGYTDRYGERKKYSEATVELRADCWKAFFSHQLDMKHIFKGVKFKRSRTKGFSKFYNISFDQKMRLLAGCTHICQTAFITWLMNGPRPVESYNLRTSWVEWNYDSQVYRCYVNGKDHERVISIVDGIENFHEYIKWHPYIENPNACFFLNEEGNPITDKWARDLFRRLSPLADIPENVNLTQVKFRHGRTTELIEKRTPLPMVEAIMGSKEIRQYFHPSVESKETVLKEISGKRELELEILKTKQKMLELEIKLREMEQNG